MPTLEDLHKLLTDQAVVRNLVTSGVLLIAVLLLRGAAVRTIRKVEWSSDDDRMRWTAMMRRTLAVITFLGLLMIWATELQTLALSLVAVAAAFVLATKELILCVSGGVLRATARMFSLGDRIEIGTTRGDVVNYGPLATTIREIGPGHQWTGRSVVVPNSALLSTPVINESFTQDYVLHLLSFPLKLEEDWKAAEEILLEAAHEACAEYLEDAKSHLEHVASEHGLPSPVVEPRVTLHIPESGKLNLLLRVPARAREKGRIEQQIVRRFVETVPPSPSQ